MGCPVIYDKIMDLYRHFAKRHTAEELLRWHISKEVLGDGNDAKFTGDHTLCKDEEVRRVDC